MNNRGQFGLVLFFILLFIIMALGIIIAIVVGVLDYAGDEITPLATSLGVIDNFNASDAGRLSIGTVNNIVQMLPWIAGFGYICMLLFSIIFAVYYNQNPHPVFLALYFFLALLLIMGSIIMSNAYEDIYSAGDDLSSRLQEQTILSFLVLYSPLVMTIIVFITGIYIFASPTKEGYV